MDEHVLEVSCELICYECLEKKEKVNISRYRFQLLHARGRSPSGKEYYHSYNMDLMHNKKVYRAPFKVR